MPKVTLEQQPGDNRHRIVIMLEHEFEEEKFYDNVYDQAIDLVAMQMAEEIKPKLAEILQKQLGTLGDKILVAGLKKLMEGE